MSAIGSLRRSYDTHTAVWAAAALIAGILLHSAGAGILIAAIGALSGGILLCLRRREGFLLLVAAAGWLSARLHEPNLPPESWFGRERAMSATIVEDNVRATGRLVLDVDCPTGVFRAEALNSDFSREYLDGQRVQLQGELRRLRDVEDLPYAFGGDLAALRRGCTARIDLAAAPVITDSTPSWRARCQARLELALLDAGISDDALGLYSAVLLGDDSMVPPAALAHFRAVGVAHALALSGFHIAFIAMLAGALLYWMRIWPRTYGLRLVLIALTLWAYAAMTGLAPSTVRACVMASVLLLARLRGGRPAGWNALGLAAALILAADPHQLYSVGFLLSVCAVAGILAFSKALNPVDPRRRLAFAAVDFAAMPIAAVLGACAVTAAVFHTAPVFFLLSGIFISAIFPALMLCGVAMLAAGFLGWGCPAVAAAGNAPVVAIEAVVAEMAAWSPGGGAALYLSPAGLACVIGVVVAGAVAVNSSLRKASLALLAVAAILTGTSFATPPEYPAEEIFAVPVGRSVALVVRSGSEARAVINTQPRYASAAAVHLRELAAPYLQSRGCDSLIVADGDFSFGSVRRRGQYLLAGRTSISIPTGKAMPDSMPGGAEYMLLTNQCRVKAEDALRRVNPDTLVLAPVLSEPRRSEYLRAAAARNIGIIDMSQRVWAPMLQR